MTSIKIHVSFGIQASGSFFDEFFLLCAMTQRGLLKRTELNPWDFQIYNAMTPSPGVEALH